MRKEFVCVVLCAFFRFLPQFTAGSGLEIVARIVGEDLANLSLCYLAFYLIGRQDLRAKTAVAYLFLLIACSAAANAYMFSFDQQGVCRAFFMIILSAIAFVAIPATIMRPSRPSDLSDDYGIVNLVMRRPENITCCLFSSVFEQCTSCSVIIGKEWYRFNKKTSSFEITDSARLNTEKFITVSTRFRATDNSDQALLRAVGTEYSLLKNNCCSVFQPMFNQLGLFFGWYHVIPTLFAHKVLK